MTMGQPAARVEQDTAGWRQRSDLVLNYLTERIVFEPGRFVISADLLADVNSWLSGRGQQQWSAELMSDKLSAHPLLAEHSVSKGRRYRSESGLSRPDGYQATDSVRFAAWSGMRFRARADDLAESKANQDEQESRNPENPETPGQAEYGTGGTTSPVYGPYAGDSAGYRERSSHPSQDHSWPSWQQMYEAAFHGADQA